LLFLLPLAMSLWPGPARAAPCVAAPALIRAGATGYGLSELVDVNGTLFFAAGDSASGVELWKSDGTPAGTVLVKDIRMGVDDANPSALTAVGATLFFLVPGVTQGVELWKSDGTAGGTVLLKAFLSAGDLTAMGGMLYFAAEPVSGDVELWKSDGTPTGTVLVKDINPGPPGSFPFSLTAVGSQLFFRANASSGHELWRSDGTPTGTVLVKDINPGPSGSFPFSLTPVGQLLFFTAVGELGNTALWRSDGTELGTVLVRDFGDTAGATLQSFTAAGNLLFFEFGTLAYGAELWKSDGTPMGTVLVKDIQPGPNSSSPQELTAVGSTLFFVANDGVHGAELWKSDGSPAGTRLVRDIVPGSGNPAIGQLAAGPGVLVMRVDDLRSGAEPWRSDGTLEGTHRMVDLAQGPSESAPREFISMGNNLFFAAKTGASGEELFVMPLNQVDCTPPTLTCPASVDIEALSSQGIRLDHPPLGAVDDALLDPAVFFNPVPGMLPLGRTRVTVAARDLAGNSTTCNLDIAVVDRTGPLLLCPERVEQEATGPNGVKAHFFVVANDAVTQASQLSLVYQPPLGTEFPVGTTPVTVTATDAALNMSPCTFLLTVRDTTPPRLRCPSDVFRVAMSEEALTVNYTVVAPDDVSGNSQLIIDHPSGSRFPLGETTVNVQARDGAGNTAQCSFKVMVVDPQGPSITCPETQYARTSGEQGAVVNFSGATAADNLGSPTISYSHTPGSTFPEGETEVTATASDLGGQSASCTFKVVVERGGGASSDTSCQAAPWSGSLGWLLLVLIPAWARRRAERVRH
jgi:ELWxxDGT repeat protein